MSRSPLSAFARVFSSSKRRGPEKQNRRPHFESLESRRLLYAGDPDDQVSENIPNAGNLSAVGYSRNGFISAATDVDLIKVQAVEGQRLGVFLTSLSEVQPRLRLFGPLGFGSSTSLQELGEAFAGQLLQYPIPRTATYYIGVSELANGFYNINTGGSDFSSPAAKLGEYRVTVGDMNSVDLIGTNFTVPDRTFSSSETVSVNATIRNNGSVTSSVFDVAFYLSRNDTISSFDTLLGKTRVTGIPAAGTRALTVNLQIPAGFTGTGQHYVGMIIDVDNVIAETNESNNANRGINLDYDSMTLSSGDTIPPQLVSLSPSDDSTDVKTNAPLKLTFNEEIRKGSGNIVVRRLADNSVFQSVPVSGTGVTINNQELSVALPQLLEEGIGYYIELSDSVIRDIAGNAFSGISGNSQWNFRTEGGETLEEKARRLDQAHDFTTESTASFNWGGQNEKWILAGDRSWYFILPNGHLYRWGGGSRSQLIQTGTLLGVFNATYHADLAKLITASDSEETLSEKAYRVDQALDLTVLSTASFNWGGQNEIWIRSASLTWYFMLPGGQFYRWGGGSRAQLVSGSELLETFDATYYADPDKLINAPDPGETLEEKAYRLDQQLGFASESTPSFNWGGQSEKWILASDRRWYFMLANGALYRWGGGSRSQILQTSEWLTDFDATFYVDIDKLVNAPRP